MFDFLLPQKCIHCHSISKSSLCDLCQPELTQPTRIARYIDGVPIYSSLVYDGVIRSTIIGMKERGLRALAVHLTEILTRNLLDLHQNLKAEFIGVPIPSNKNSRRLRGFDHLSLILPKDSPKEFCEFDPRALQVIRKVKDQQQLTLKDRQKNLVNAYEFRPRLLPRTRKYVLIDDVITTGSSIRAGIAAVRAGGGEVLAATTLAHSISANSWEPALGGLRYDTSIQ